MAKPGRRKTAAKVAPKKVIQDLVATAERLAEDASPVIPRVEGGGWLARGVRKAAREMEKVAALSGDEAKLRRWARKPTLAGALAVTLLLPHTRERIGHLAQAKVGDREVLYAQRGRVPKEFIVSIQHHTDPQLRLWAYHRLLRRRPLWAIAAREGVLVLSVAKGPPAEVLSSWGLQGLLSCAHRGEPENRQPARLELDLVGSDVTLYHCPEEHGDGELLRFLRLTANLHPRVVRLRHAGSPFTCAGRCDPCPALEEAVRPHAALDAAEMLAGHKTPEALLAEVRRAARETAKGLDRPVVIAGRTCYGEDRDALVSAIAPSDEERPHLARALAGLKNPAVADDDSPNKLLAALWPQIGEPLLAALAGDVAAARRLLDRTNLSPREQMKEAAAAARAAETLKGLPRYAPLPPTTGLVDEAARAYKVGGMKALLDVAVTHQGDRTPHLKPVLFALYDVAGEAEGRRWQFSKDDAEHGAALALRVRALIDASGSEYHAELARIHSYLGQPGEPRKV